MALAAGLQEAHCAELKIDLLVQQARVAEVGLASQAVGLVMVHVGVIDCTGSMEKQYTCKNKHCPHNHSSRALHFNLTGRQTWGRHVQTQQTCVWWLLLYLCLRESSRMLLVKVLQARPAHLLG